MSSDILGEGKDIYLTQTMESAHAAPAHEESATAAPGRLPTISEVIMAECQFFAESKAGESEIRSAEPPMAEISAAPALGKK